METESSVDQEGNDASEQLKSLSEITTLRQGQKQLLNSLAIAQSLLRGDSLYHPAPLPLVYFFTRKDQ